MQILIQLTSLEDDIALACANQPMLEVIAHALRHKSNNINYYGLFLMSNLILSGNGVAKAFFEYKPLFHQFLGLVNNTSLSKNVAEEVAYLSYNFIINFNKELFVGVLREEFGLAIVAGIKNSVYQNTALIAYLKSLLKLLQFGEDMKETYSMNPVANELSSCEDLEEVIGAMDKKPGVVKALVEKICDLLDHNNQEKYF